MKGVLTRVIGIGQPAAGDDNAGIAVARALRGQPVPASVEIHEISDPGQLIELLDGIQRTILIDAVVNDSRPGDIQFLTPEDLEAYSVTPLSSHGMSVAEAIALVYTLEPEAVGSDICIIGVTIERPDHYTCAMSSPVTAAVPRAVSLILKLLEG